MDLCSFYGQVPKLRVRDPLAALLGCPADGVFEYGFVDAVRLTGHACPTVAAAYWMTCLTLRHLYPDTLPERGGVRVEFQQGLDDGSMGVVAAVVGLLTGAGDSAGFKGLCGRYSRAGLMRYSPDLALTLRFTRLDTRDAVDAGVDLALVPADPALEPLLRNCLDGRATAAERLRFQSLWQWRVRQLLLEHHDDPAVYLVRPVGPRRPVRAPRAQSTERRMATVAKG